MDFDPNVVLLPVFVLRYPLYNAASLIQIGHEPLASYATKNIWGKSINALPNVFQYARHIGSVDGSSGCYRGLSAVMCYHSVYGSVHKNLRNMLTDEKSRYEVNAANLVRSLVAQTAAVVVSQPFHVIAVRTIAQFVGREENYRGVFASIAEVYRAGGVLGFFAGLVPLLLGELAATCLATWLTMAARRCINNPESRAQQLAPVCSKLVAYFVFLPLQTVGNTMAVNNCGLAAGTPTYAGWLDCWRHLAASKQLLRANWLFWRSTAGGSTAPRLVDVLDSCGVLVAE